MLSHYKWCLTRFYLAYLQKFKALNFLIYGDDLKPRLYSHNGVRLVLLLGKYDEDANLLAITCFFGVTGYCCLDKLLSYR